MKLVHNATISCLCKEYEDIDAVRSTFETFLPENLEKEKIVLTEEHLKIEEGENLISLKVQLEKNRHIKVLLTTLFALLSTEQKHILATQHDRIDDKGAFYLRLDKEQLVQENTATLVDHGNCIHFKFLLAAYPKNKENALRVRDELLAQYK